MTTQEASIRAMVAYRRAVWDVAIAVDAELNALTQWGTVALEHGPKSLEARQAREEWAKKADARGTANTGASEAAAELRRLLEQREQEPTP